MVDRYAKFTSGSLAAAASCSGQPPPGRYVKFFFGDGRCQSLIELMGPYPVIPVHQVVADVALCFLRLVHHFLQRFNMQSVQGRTAANTYLDECSQIIDARHSTHIGFNKELELSRAKLASFIDSQEFEDAVLKGDLPSSPPKFSRTPLMSAFPSTGQQSARLRHASQPKG